MALAGMLFRVTPAADRHKIENRLYEGMDDGGGGEVVEITQARRGVKHNITIHRYCAVHKY